MSCGKSLAILGWVAAAVLAFIFAPQAQPLIKQIPVLSDFLGDSCELSIIAAFAAVFALSLIVVSIFTSLFSSAVQRSALGGVDQALGFLFGVLRGIVLVAVAFVVYDRVIAGGSVPMVDDSRSAKVFASMQDPINGLMPQDAPGWIVGALRGSDRGLRCARRRHGNNRARDRYRGRDHQPLTPIAHFPVTVA